MENNELLKQVGLDEKEASVYLALLEFGMSTVYAIATKAGLKRPTTYLILDNLEKKGLVSLVPHKKVSLYAVQSPEKLLADVKKKHNLLAEQMPNLLALYNANSEKPHMQLFQGKEGVESVYKKMLNAKEARIFTTIRDIEQTYPEFLKDFIEASKRKDIRVKEILTKGVGDLKFANTIEHGEYYEQRFASGDGAFQTDTVVFFSFKPFIMAVMISSKDIYQSMHTLFELAWKSADKYEDVIKVKMQ